MTKFTSLKKTVSAAALALPLITGFAAIASAHSNGACANSVVDSCNAQYPGNYDARIACVSNGLAQCQGHSHGGGGGGGGNSSASDNKTTDAEPEQSRGPRFKKFRR